MNAARRDPDPAQTAAGLEPAVETLGFEDALASLRGIVEQLESGGLPLEASVDRYERGVALHERCVALLDQAELRLRRLTPSGGGPAEPNDEPFDDA